MNARDKIAETILELDPVDHEDRLEAADAILAKLEPLPLECDEIVAKMNADSLAENHVHLKARIAELEAERDRAVGQLQEITDYGLPMSWRIMAQARTTLAAIKETE